MSLRTVGLLISVLLACEAKEGRSCASDGEARCDGNARMLFCANGEWTAIACGGAAGCSASPRFVDCDESRAAVDPALATQRQRLAQERLLLQLATGPVVPGHGAVVDRDFVATQHDELTRLAWLIRDGHADDAPVEQVARQAPFGPDAAQIAVRRGYAELSGRAWARGRHVTASAAGPHR